MMVHFKLVDFLLYRKDAQKNATNVSCKFASVLNLQSVGLWVTYLLFNLLFQLTKLHDAIVLDLSVSLIKVKKKR